MIRATMKLLIPALVASAFTVLPTTRLAAGPPPKGAYRIESLGVLPGGRLSLAYSINNRGQVVGLSDNGGTTGSEQLPDTRAMLWEKDYATDLIGRDLPAPCAKKVNDAGEILIGYEYISASLRFSLSPPPAYDVVLWSKKKRVIFRGEGGGFVPTSMNNRGILVGSDQVSGSSRAAWWKRGVVHHLPVPPDTMAGEAMDVNDRGDICGWYQKADGFTHTFIYRNGKRTDIAPYLNWFNGGLRAINSRGDAVGAAQALTGDHAFLWQGGRLTDLGTCGGGIMRPTAINSKGAVLAMTLSGPALYQKGRWIDLREAVPPESGWQIMDAQGMNDRGQIVGSGMFRGKRCAYLLTPREEAPQPARKGGRR